MHTQTLRRADTVEHQSRRRPGTAPLAGTMWRIDPVHSTVGFSIKHMAFATVHGRFGAVEGTIRLDGDRPDDISVEVRIDTATIDTGEPRRDQHLRSADFFDVAAYPTIAFRSTWVEPIVPFPRERWLAVGDLTIHGVTRPVELAVEQRGGRPNPWDAEATSFAVTATISRRAFGVGLHVPLGAGLVIGDEVTVAIDVQATRDPVAGR